MSQENFLTNFIDSLIQNARQQINSWPIQVNRLEQIKSHIGDKTYTQNDLLTLVYLLYQSLDNIVATSKMLYICGIVAKSDTKKDYRKVTPEDVTAIIDFIDIEDKELESSVRLYYNRKRGLDDDWNFNGNFKLFVKNAKEQGYILTGAGPKDVTLRLMADDSQH